MGYTKYTYTGLRQLRYLSLLVFMLAITSVVFAHEESGETGKAGPRGPIFSALLPDVPGKRITVYKLTIRPRTSDWKSRPHRHPGSVYLYVTKGTVRLGIGDQPVKVVHAGESFFEPAGAIHSVTENASTTEPATIIAVMIIPDGAAPTIPVTGRK